jgi:hypothetical protein
MFVIKNKENARDRNKILLEDVSVPVDYSSRTLGEEHIL